MTQSDRCFPLFNIDEVSAVTRPPYSQKQVYSYIFAIITTITLLVWILRGLEVLAFLPGVVIWILLMLSIAMGVLRQVSR
ncbi:putative membrane protein [Lyngbya aestuarii BL J]|uniref:Putative membrane protein n=1 Tax=Lyngbya aestuarii BL J TaxID=1348334 RepID=U7QHP0_9CYAN|nr:putative membrane protein [Lyngbya aestuarii BL J]